MSTTVYVGDNLNIITNNIQNKSIDFIYFNPPFGITKQVWDEKLNWIELFKQFFRVLKEDGILAIHCSVPFNYTLIRDAPKAPAYSWYWHKDRVTNPLIANLQPLRNTEEILVWTNKRNRYFPQRIGNESRSYNAYGGITKDDCYYANAKVMGKKNVIGYYQTHHIDMKRNIDGFSTRPYELIELMIKSYTKEGDTILDPTCYKGVCGLIAKGLSRKYIGIDKYFYPEKIINGYDI